MITLIENIGMNVFVYFLVLVFPISSDNFFKALPFVENKEDYRKDKVSSHLSWHRNWPLLGLPPQLV